MTRDTEAPVTRRGAIDIARSGSLVLVVVAHLTMVVLDRNSDGSLRGVNLFELYPRFEWLTMLSPMPLFFAASGWANAGSASTSRLKRAAVLTTLATVVAVLWSTATVVERFLSGGNGIVADGARIATQPLWFLTAWVPFTVCADVLTRAARRITPAVASCLVVLAVADALRFLGDAPRWVGYPGFFAAWAVPWMLGAWWRQRHDDGCIDEGPSGTRLAVMAAVALVPLVVFFGYHAALIDAVPGNRSNTTPPTLFTAVAAMVQVGVFIALARWLDTIAARRARAIRSLDALAPGLYVWHLTALSLWGALLAAGVWTPDRLTPGWWLTRPVWFAVVVGTSVALSIPTRRALAPLQAITPHSDQAVAWRTTVAVVASTVSFGVIGLYGPDTTMMAIAVAIGCLVSCATMLSILRGPRARVS